MVCVKRKIGARELTESSTVGAYSPPQVDTVGYGVYGDLIIIYPQPYSIHKP